MYNSGLLLSVIETGTITYDVYIYDYDFKICFQRSNLQQHPVPRGLVPRAGAHRARQLSVRGPRPAACQEPQWSIEPDPGQQLTGSGPRPRLWPQGHRHPGGLVDGGRHPAHHLHRGHPGYVTRDTWRVTVILFVSRQHCIYLGSDQQGHWPEAKLCQHSHLFGESVNRLTPRHSMTTVET